MRQRDAQGRFVRYSQPAEPQPAVAPDAPAPEFAELLLPPETREFNRLLAKTPARTRLVSFCRLCGRVGGGCGPVEREVPESAIALKSWGSEYVDYDYRG